MFLANPTIQQLDFSSYSTPSGRQKWCSVPFSSPVFSQWPFLHYDEAKDDVYCHTCLMALKHIILHELSKWGKVYQVKYPLGHIQRAKSFLLPSLTNFLFMAGPLSKCLLRACLYSLHGCCSVYSIIGLDHCTYASVVYGPGCLLTYSE